MGCRPSGLVTVDQNTSANLLTFAEFPGLAVIGGQEFRPSERSRFGERQLRIDPVERDAPDLVKLARALIALAQQEQEVAETKPTQNATEDVSTEDAA